MNRSAATLIALIVLAMALVASRAAAIDRNLAGSAQLDYAFVPTSPDASDGKAPGTYGFDGFTLEATEKLAVDVSDKVSANAKLCFGCHGFELDMTYIDYRVADEFNIRAGRFSPSFGAFNLRHDVANHKLSDKPLAYDMGRMLRLRTWNMGVLPSPFPDNGLEINGTHWFGGSTELDYAIYAIEGFKSEDAHPLDIDFKQSRMPYYVDNNSRPTVGARLAMTQKLGALSDMTLGGSGMYGTYDRNNELAYAIVGADLSFRIERTSLRMEYLARRTEMDTSDAALLALRPASNKSAYWKQGAYVELEQRLTDSFDLLGRVDGLYRTGNFAAADPTSDEADEVALSRRSYIVRYTLGGAYALDRAFRVKLSAEFWQFSDEDDDGKKIALSTHLAFVGTY
ncbi:MAG TPA: hypothetical protein VH062_22495 [Polyangiaceae bacterium]|nr:hypothetical protein [Polyangiaceae bacterium]